MEQGLFDLDGDSTPEPARPYVTTWDWWTPWPDNLSVRNQLLYQIRRDMRAFAEEEDDWWRLFFADRIALFQEEVKRLDKTQSL